MNNDHNQHKSDWTEIRRKTDFEIIGNWIEPNSQILDLGCGEGELISCLEKEKNVYGIGVDKDTEKVIKCLKKNIPVYQDEVQSVLKNFPDKFFDWIIFSRIIEDLNEPGEILKQSLRVGKHLAVGFINHGFWLNRLHFLFKGSRIINSVYTDPWHISQRTNPFSLKEFEKFCKENEIQILKKNYLSSDWVNSQTFFPNTFAGYAIYKLTQ